MPATSNLQRVLDLAGPDTPVHPASDVKSSWGVIVKNAMRHGEVIVTHHHRPEVVVMDVAAYADLARRAEANGPLQALRAGFDRRFTKLNTDTGSARLRRIAAGGIPAPARPKAGRKPGAAKR